jgi:WD40 repeat protein
MGQPRSSNGGQTGESRLPSEAEVAARVAIPEHQLLGCIGRGSYGQVWLARNAMGAYRAVKIVFRDSFQNHRPFERELSGIRKFEPISRSHEGFIDVLQVGINEQGGYFYYIMEVGDDQVAGQTIDPKTYAPNTLGSEILRRGRLSLQECLQLGLALTHALAELHKDGLVHRDIKPSNVIFVDGVPKLADIGLVADVHDTHSYVGTEGFIPPEGPGDPQADLFSLGMVLYEASTGNDRHDYPELPEEWSQSLEYDGLLELNEIILKACKTNPKERYLSAWDMHADLVVVVNGKSVKRLRLLERRMEQIKRFAGVAALVLAIALIIGFQVYRERRVAAEERRRQVAANVTYGNRAMEQADLFGALPYFAEALRLDQGNAAGDKTHRLRLGSTLALCPKLTQMWFAPGQVSDVEFSPDGKNVLLAQYFGKAEIHDLQTGKLYSHAFGPRFGLRGATYSTDGRFILTTSESHTALVWDAALLTQVLPLPHTNAVYAGSFSPDGHQIVTACGDGITRVWDARTGRLEFALPRQSDVVAFAGFSHNGRFLVTASHDGTARVWSTTGGRPVTPPLLHPMWVNWASFSPDDEQVVTACEDHKARVWDVASGRRIMPDLRHNDAVETAEFSPDGRLILTASYDGTARLWDAADHQPASPNSLLRHGERVTHASFSADGRRVITACTDGSVRVWDLAGAAMPPAAKRRLFCRDAGRFLVISNDSFKIYDAANGKVVGPAFSPSPVVETVQLCSDGRFVLTSSAHCARGETNHVIQVWDADTGKSVGPGVSVSTLFAGAAVSDNGQRVATYGSNIARIWDPQAGTAVSLPLSHGGPVTLAVFSPNAALLTTASDTNVQVWDTETGKLIRPPFQLPVPVAYVEFSRDGQLLVTCCSDPMLTKCSAQVWNMQTGRPMGEPLRHSDGVLSASFNADGRFVVTASEDFTAKVWRTDTGRQVGLPLRHAGQVQSAAFSPDGQWVATASIDHTARIWDSQSGDAISPPLQHLVGLWDIKLLPDGHHLAIGDGLGNTFEWDLHIDSRPAAAIGEMVEFLSGGDFISPVSPTKRPKESLSAIWQRLRGRYPRDFTSSDEEIVSWHEFQVEASEAEGQWSAAKFHLECLLRLRPSDLSLSEHLARVKEHLQ